MSGNGASLLCRRRFSQPVLELPSTESLIDSFASNLFPVIVDRGNETEPVIG